MRGGMFGWDYPPGVTGREPQIAGADGECPECGGPVTEDARERTADCEECGWGTGFDWDAKAEAELGAAAEAMKEGR